MHINGRYYIGRHTTSDLEDGYLGSGVWVSGVKDKSTLFKEILFFATSTPELKEIEEKIINENYNDPMCMNRGKGSNGWTSEEATEENRARVISGTHNFLGGKIPKETQLKRVANGTHQWLGDKNPTYQRLADGSHTWLSDEHKELTSIRNKERLENKSHHFLTKVQCPHCIKEGQLTAMKRWHFDNCKNRG